MTDAKVHQWRAGAPNAELDAAIARASKAEDVVHVAVMPDAHVADSVCVGTVTATTRRILPSAVGGDIGCGMAAVRFDADVERLADIRVASKVLRELARTVPGLVHPTRSSPELPLELTRPLSHPRLSTLAERDGRVELGTLGRGNHFLELQKDEQGALWLLVHSGSRCMGPAIRRHHEDTAERDLLGFAWLDADSVSGRAYLDDASWAAEYAKTNRERIVARASEIVSEALDTKCDSTTHIACDHNHVRRERHGERDLWVHRKGAMRIDEGVLGVIPGSMGTASFHVVGRDVGEALHSCAHGAGRALARGEARRRIRARDLDEQMRGVWFDSRLRDRLRDEAPSAYKDIGEVMKAQRELVRVVRKLTPLLVYKAA